MIVIIISTDFMVNKMLTVPTNAIPAEQARKASYEELESILQNAFTDISQMSKSEYSAINNHISFTIPGKYYYNDEIIDEIIVMFEKLGYIIYYKKVGADYSACPPFEAYVWFRVLW